MNNDPLLPFGPPTSTSEWSKQVGLPAGFENWEDVVQIRFRSAARVGYRRFCRATQTYAIWKGDDEHTEGLFEKALTDLALDLGIRTPGGALARFDDGTVAFVSEVLAGSSLLVEQPTVRGIPPNLPQAYAWYSHLYQSELWGFSLWTDHYDVHPGNFVIDENGLAAIDFGWTLGHGFGKIFGQGNRWLNLGSEEPIDRMVAPFMTATGFVNAVGIPNCVDKACPVHKDGGIPFLRAKPCKNPNCNMPMTLLRAIPAFVNPSAIDKNAVLTWASELELFSDDRITEVVARAADFYGDPAVHSKAMKLAKALCHRKKKVTNWVQQRLV